jgi:acetate kinase
MTDVILALNVGSSSIKFTLFVTTNGMDAFSLLYQGRVEGLGTQPHFLVYDTTGQRLVDERLLAKTAAVLSHEEALGVLLDGIAYRRLRGTRCACIYCRHW